MPYPASRTMDNKVRKISTGSLYETNMRKVSTASMYENSLSNYSQESLLSAMERFFKSVNTMNSIVMVPSKLVDIESEDEDVTTSSSSASSTCSTCSQVGGSQNLYSTYKMLVEAKEDLTWRRDNSESNFDADEMTEAKQFKHHLEALNGLLTQFAGLADNLTEKYQNAPGIKDSN